VTELLPAVSPPGANDFTCRPSSALSAPVVLVHGTFESAVDNWSTVSPQLKNAGYCVFALEYGERGTGDIAASAAQLARFVDAVLGIRSVGAWSGVVSALVPSSEDRRRRCRPTSWRGRRVARCIRPVVSYDRPDALDRGGYSPSWSVAAAGAANQRSRRLEPKCSFSSASSVDGALNVPVFFGPERKSMSTRATRPSPNST
jgi:hypothetical protein